MNKATLGRPECTLLAANCKQLLTNVIKYFVAGYLGVPTECLTTGLHVPRWVYFLTGTEIQWTLSLPKQDTIVLNWENNYFINMNPSLATPVICTWIALSTLGAGDSTLIGTRWPWTLHCPNINTAGDKSCPQLENRKHSLTPNSCWTVNCSRWHCLFWYFSHLVMLMWKLHLYLLVWNAH